MLTRIHNRLKRDASRLLARRMVQLEPAEPIVSFTFDDFPRSALLTGGRILLEHGFRGTYYTSFGLMNKTAPTGEIFREEDLPEFIRQGHELGCHTFDHCHSWDTPAEEFEASMLRNREATAKLLPGTKMQSMSYPISGPRPGTKRKVEKLFGCARGGGQTHNLGLTDLNFLNAFFIEQSRDNYSAIKEAIDSAVRSRAWLIFATHDVSDTPTQFGCTPALFEQIVTDVAKSGARVLPIFEAFKLLGGRPQPTVDPLLSTVY